MPTGYTPPYPRTSMERAMAFDAKQMERDILEAVNTHGMILRTGTPRRRSPEGKIQVGGRRATINRLYKLFDRTALSVSVL